MSSYTDEILQPVKYNWQFNVMLETEKANDKILKGEMSKVGPSFLHCIALKPEIICQTVCLWYSWSSKHF